MARTPRKTRCEHPGCDKSGKIIRGLCSMHYMRLLRHGDPEATRNTYRSVMPSGYIRIWSPGHPLGTADGYVLEHRMVWYAAHGVIPDGWHIHHLNHDKTDNRLENLELLSASEHHGKHVREAGWVTNQFGTWRVKAGV